MLRLLQTNIRALLLRSVESWVGIQNIIGYVSIAELWFPYDRTIAEYRTWFSSSGIACDHDRGSVFPSDRKRLQNVLRSAILDRLRAYGNQP